MEEVDGTGSLAVEDGGPAENGFDRSANVAELSLRVLFIS